MKIYGKNLPCRRTFVNCLINLQPVLRQKIVRNDVEFAQNVGGKGIFLLTGHGKKHLKEIPQNTIILPDINAAADWIVSDKSKREKHYNNCNYY
ncbi:MAG: hypothetical protein BWY69_00717 [Planctomycetes bacterium ADurb.Bin401]|nr:MAG: hypothetical protein BWY69_00717 [Planctomycetes bacterium ADurb.Bin401]